MATAALAAKNLLQLAQRLWQESGRTGPGPAALATAQADALRMFNAIRDQWRMLQMEPHNWKWMRQTTTGACVVGQIAYTAAQAGATNWAAWWPPGDDYRPWLVDVADSNIVHELEYLGYEDFRNRYQRTTHDAALPRHWSTAPNGSILLGPKPDAAYPLRADFETLPTDLTDDEHVPELPTQFQMLLVWMALEDIAINDGAVGRLARARKNKAIDHARLIEDQGESPTIDEWGPLA